MNRSLIYNRWRNSLFDEFTLSIRLKAGNKMRYKFIAVIYFKIVWCRKIPEIILYKLGHGVYKDDKALV